MIQGKQLTGKLKNTYVLIAVLSRLNSLWKNYEAEFHVLTKPPQMNLCIPATFVPSESTADQYVVNFVCFLRM